MSEELLKPDLCVIGAGSGGLSVAAAAAAFGVPVVLIEKGKMGGDCLNYGCVPSKALLAAAKQAQAMREAGVFGIAGVEPEVDFAAVQDHVRSVIETIAPNDSVARFTALGVRVVQAQARFVDKRTVEAGGMRIAARRFVIATGSSPAVPPIEGLDSVAHLTNETLFELKRRPGHLVILGGGAIGMEMAQAHRRLGSAVTVLEAGQALGKDDPELTAFVVARLREEGVSIREATKVTRVEKRGRNGVRVHVETGGTASVVDGTHLLVAAGRTPNIDGLGLDRAGIAHDRRGVTVDAGLRTSNARVYAIGDVAGGPQFTHVANYHAGLVIRSALFRLRARENRSIIPWVTYTDPELAHVGLSEAETRQRKLDVRILRWPYAENDRAQAERATRGLIKIIVGRRGRILGASIVGPHAGEMIHVWSLALSRKLKLSHMAAYVAPYPTLGEIGKRAAITYFADATRNPFVRRLIRFLRRFG